MKSLKNSRIRKSTRLNKLKSKQDLSVHFKIVLDNSNQNDRKPLKQSSNLFFFFRFDSISNRIERNRTPPPKRPYLPLYFAHLNHDESIQYTATELDLYSRYIHGLFYRGPRLSRDKRAFSSDNKAIGEGRSRR